MLETKGWRLVNFKGKNGPELSEEEFDLETVGGPNAAKRSEFLAPGSLQAAKCRKLRKVNFFKNVRLFMSFLISILR